MITRLVHCGCKVKGIEEAWSILDSAETCFCFTCVGMLTVRSLVEGDLSSDCQR